MKTAEHIRIHRFRDQVAINAHGSSETSYITPAMARKLATELRAFADNIEGKRASTNGTGGWVATRIVEHVDETPYPIGKARAYTESTGRAPRVLI